MGYNEENSYQKPDLKGGLQKLKNLKKEDIVAHWKASRERRDGS